ncbi:MAG: hypothetical protein K0R24_186 [Gammaproteobacteria bacterium]|jgi:PIN domain nuclease of toxin-antitoxin system|nr:hypothetical protein [Gammaproteobacteria bacterium]
MHLLLDTHLFLWWLKKDRNLSVKARTLIVDADEVYISSASIWEAVIKIKLGKLTANSEVLVNSISSEGFIELPITAQHAAYVSGLPDYHRDPFDRILIAQALSEPLRFLTADQQLAKYSKWVELV